MWKMILLFLRSWPIGQMEGLRSVDKCKNPLLSQWVVGGSMRLSYVSGLEGTLTMF